MQFVTFTAEEEILRGGEIKVDQSGAVVLVSALCANRTSSYGCEVGCIERGIGGFVVLNQTAGTHVGTVSELVEAAIVCRCTEVHGKGETRLNLWDTGDHPAPESPPLDHLGLTKNLMPRPHPHLT